jgi:hypothetical protein
VGETEAQRAERTVQKPLSQKQMGDRSRLHLIMTIINHRHTQDLLGTLHHAEQFIYII